MKVRTLLTMTAIVSSILGATAAYLALTVPNDLNADAMLKRARKDLAEGKTEAARTSLAHIVQQYPRTDAAAAATVALTRIGDQERNKLQGELEAIRQDSDRQKTAIEDVRHDLDEIRKTPPRVIVQQAPKPAPAKKPVAKKKTTTTTKKRRR